MFIKYPTPYDLLVRKEKKQSYIRGFQNAVEQILEENEELIQGELHTKISEKLSLVIAGKYSESDSSFKYTKVNGEWNENRDWK